MKDQHKLISGYADLEQHEIDNINQIKDFEDEVYKMIEEMNDPSLDQRRLALAKTHLETGFMFFIKAVARPTR